MHSIWHQATPTRVCLKWRPRRTPGHLQYSEIAFFSTASRPKRNSTSHRGLSQVSTMDGWPAEHHWQLKSPELQLICALTLSWWSSRLRTLFRGRRLHHAWKTLGKQLFTYRSAVAVFLSVWYGGNVAGFCRETRHCLLRALLFLLKFADRFSFGKTPTHKYCFVSRSY